jgi:hypothetical protein
VYGIGTDASSDLIRVISLNDAFHSNLCLISKRLGDGDNPKENLPRNQSQQLLKCYYVTQHYKDEPRFLKVEPLERLTAAQTTKSDSKISVRSLICS